MTESKPARPLPRRRPPAISCAECGYSLRGTRNLKCPECGTQWTLSALEHEHSWLLSTRDRCTSGASAVALIALAVFILCVVHVVPAAWIPFNLVPPGPGSLFGKIAGGGMAMVFIVIGCIFGWPAITGRQTVTAAELHEAIRRNNPDDDDSPCWWFWRS